jgi:hypothetical protein
VLGHRIILLEQSGEQFDGESQRRAARWFDGVGLYEGENCYTPLPPRLAGAGGAPGFGREWQAGAGRGRAGGSTLDVRDRVSLVLLFFTAQRL